MTATRSFRRSIVLRGLVALVVTLALSGTRPGPAAGSAMEPPGPAAVQSGVDYYCVIYACYTLTVALSGDGSGTWQSTDSSHVPTDDIHCVQVNGVVTAGSKCSGQIGNFGQPISVYYTMTATAGSTACIHAQCYSSAINGQLSLSNNVVLDWWAFGVGSYPVSVTKSGAGTGTVTSLPTGINCGPTLTCAADFLFGSTVGLTADADPGAYFSGWTGACAGQGATCTIASIPASTTTTNAVFSFGTPTASPPAATTKPPATPRPSATLRSGASPAAPSPSQAGATPDPSQSDAPGLSQEPSPEGTATEPSVAPSGPPNIIPAATTTGDMTPIVLAILGAGLLIAIGISIVGLALRRRPEGPRAH
jgi:hypothetical protein